MYIVNNFILSHDFAKKSTHPPAQLYLLLIVAIIINAYISEHSCKDHFPEKLSFSCLRFMQCYSRMEFDAAKVENTGQAQAEAALIGTEKGQKGSDEGAGLGESVSFLHNLSKVQLLYEDLY